MKKLFNLLILGAGIVFGVVSCKNESSEIREKIDFTHSWRFTLNDSSVFKSVDFNDADWKELDLPHDWSIEGRFDEQNPAGIGGGALPGGVGWYRKEFTLPGADSLKMIYITFDGVYQNSEVFINGHFLGKRPNGYIGFQYNISPYLVYGDKKNTIAVKVDNSDQPNSRWYSGSGIYRNVWLEKTHPIHIKHWGTNITTPSVNADLAEVEIAITIENESAAGQTLQVETYLLNENDKIVAKQLTPCEVSSGASNEVTQILKVKSPDLWSIEEPHLYRAVSTIILNKKEIDSYVTTFGIRYFNFDPEKGFSLNGKPVKIKGVCNHHDLGALGAALNVRAKERQLEILKAMGCNGIRTSHNPPSPELLDLCDRMGFIVQNETFDVWLKKKVDNDYSNYFEEWHERDLTDHLLRDRNHPSVFSWSIGNEILEQWDTLTGSKIAAELAAIVKKYMPDMPVTSGCNDPVPSNNIIKSGALDLIGFNYHHENFEAFHDSFPGQKFIATETTSSLQSRGVYNMPSDSMLIWPKRWDIPFFEGNPDNSCSAYDNSHAPWGSTHEESWKLIKKHDYLSGFYIWTGFDYIGEPTPYQWPSRSSYFGIIDLAGFPKDVYYMYQSEWTDEDVLHLFPHWNWKEGQGIDIWAYTNFDEVELFVNGQTQGVKSKQGDDVKITWRVKYEPGTLKAVGKKTDGTEKIVEIKTAGEPAKIVLEADRSTIQADGKDLSFVTVTILDKDGVPVPYADNLVTFNVSDNLAIAGVDNGCQTSHESFQGNKRNAFNGKCLVILKSKDKKAGTGKLTATSDGLEVADLELNLK